MSSLGIDIGGANLKIASENKYEIIYFPMWKRSDELQEILTQISEKYGAEKVGVVMTAELSDVFSSKQEGVSYIVQTCKKVFKKVFFMTIYGKLISEIDDPLELAASNWVASVSFLMMEGHTNFLFVDMGSTTVDVIPVTDSIKAEKSDFKRLKRKELLYFGLLRTPIFYLIREFNGVPLCPEYFAITADALLITEDISELDYSCETPDGRGKSREECMRRLARTLCCDVKELGENNIEKLAKLVKEVVVEELKKAIYEKMVSMNLKYVIACGIGEELIKTACLTAKIPCVKLSERYGEFSKLFPAYSMLKLIDRMLKN